MTEISTVEDYKHIKVQCEWKYTYILLRLRVKQVTTQKEESQKKISWAFQRSQLENLGILLEIQQKALGPGANNAGITYTSMGIHPKSCCIFPLKINWLAHLELCHRNSDMMERVLNQMALSNSTAGTWENFNQGKKLSSFRETMIQS